MKPALVVKIGPKAGGARYSPPDEGEDEDEGDPFDAGFEAFREAIESGDARAARRAFLLMKESCGDLDEEG